MKCLNIFCLTHNTQQNLKAHYRRTAVFGEKSGVKPKAEASETTGTSAPTPNEAPETAAAQPPAPTPATPVEYRVHHPSILPEPAAQTPRPSAPTSDKTLPAAKISTTRVCALCQGPLADTTLDRVCPKCHQKRNVGLLEEKATQKAAVSDAKGPAAEIMQAVATAAHVNVADLTSQSKRPEHATPRWVAMYIIHKRLRLNFDAVASLFGNRAPHGIRVACDGTADRVKAGVPEVVRLVAVAEAKLKELGYE